MTSGKPRLHGAACAVVVPIVQAPQGEQAYTEKHADEDAERHDEDDEDRQENEGGHPSIHVNSRWELSREPALASCLAEPSGWRLVRPVVPCSLNLGAINRKINPPNG